MKTLKAKIPDILVEEVNELAEKQNVTVDQIVSLALAAQVSAWRTRETIASRARRVDWQNVDEILARVPDVPAQPGDEISRGQTFRQKVVGKPTKNRATDGSIDELMQILLANDSKFAELVESHRRLEKQISELSVRRQRTAEGQAEEATLKKKKLFLKDQMEEILRRYREQEQNKGH